VLFNHLYSVTFEDEMTNYFLDFVVLQEMDGKSSVQLHYPDAGRLRTVN